MKFSSMILFILLILVSCQDNKTGQASKEVAFSAVSNNGQSGSSEDNFDDIAKLGKKDESCATEEEIKENFKPKSEEKPKAFKLQGGDPGCTVDGEEH